jgi:hypothetical protein
MTQHDVVICHAPEDEAIAERMCAVLEQEHIACWIAPRDVPAGIEARDAAVLEAISSSRLVVLVFSRSADASIRIPLELEAALARGITVLPVRVDAVTPSGSLQHTLEGSHWLDALEPPIEDHAHHLAGYVRALLDRDAPSSGPVPIAVPAAAAADAPPPSPYGPAPAATPPADALLAAPAVPAGPSPASLPVTTAAPTVSPPAADAPAADPASAPPEDRRHRTRWVLIALGALVLVLVGAVATFAILIAFAPDPADVVQSGSGTEVESGSGSGEPLPGDDSDADPDAALAERSCAVLDPADVAAVYGADTVTPSSDGLCDFADAGSITIFEEPADADSFELYRDLYKVEPTDLPDLGEGAFIDEDGLLFVLDEGHDALLLLFAWDNSPTGREQLIALAELIVADD